MAQLLTIFSFLEDDLTKNCVITISGGCEKSVWRRERVGRDLEPALPD